MRISEWIEQDRTPAKCRRGRNVPCPGSREDPAALGLRRRKTAVFLARRQRQAPDRPAAAVVSAEFRPHRGRRARRPKRWPDYVPRRRTVPPGRPLCAPRRHPGKDRLSLALRSRRRNGWMHNPACRHSSLGTRRMVARANETWRALKTGFRRRATRRPAGRRRSTASPRQARQELCRAAEPVPASA